MNDTPGPASAADPPIYPAPPSYDPPIYHVAAGIDETAVCEELLLPRRPGHGSLGVLLVDRPNQLVYLLDADDANRVFRGRARRPLAGDPTELDYPPGGGDHVVRAAVEGAYDVIAAPWADKPGTAEQVATQ